MRLVQWSDDALADLESQLLYIARNNPAASMRVAHRIRELGNALRNLATGRPGRVPGTYEKSVSRLPYVIVYALSDDDRRLTILRIIHTSRDWRPGEWPESESPGRRRSQPPENGQR